MPAAPTSYPYLSWKFNKIVLRLPIPTGFQPILGQKMFRCVMAQTTMPEAHAASLPILAEWRQQIANARTASRDHRQAEILRVRKAFEAWDGKSLTAAEIDLFDRFTDFLYQTVGGMSAQAQRLALASAKDMGHGLMALPAPARQEARQALAIANGTQQIRTPFLAHFEGEKGWKANTHLKGKSLHSAIAAIHQFASDVPCDLETLKGGMVTAWIDRQLRPKDGSKPAAPDTVRKKMVGLRNFWAWHQENDLVDTERNPFADRPIRDSRTTREIAEAKTVPFAPKDVLRLMQQAEGDRDLFAATKLGAYHALRREEICALKVEQVKRGPDGIRYFEKVGDKTVAAYRDVPVHSAAESLVDELMANAAPEGYLIHDGWIDKNGYRGGEVGSRFSAMKTEMGFKKRVETFHSLRKAAIKAMKEQRTLTLPYYESIVKNIVGHEDGDITSGLYAGDASMADKKAVIETIRY